MRIVATLASILLAFCPIIRATGPPLVGALRATGVVLANSVPMPDGGTVRSGDAIRTAPEALAVITAPAYGRLEIRPDSLARLGDGRVDLEGGSLASDRLQVGLGLYTVRPAGSAAAWFAVANRNGRLLVAAYRGGVLITSAGFAPLLVKEGSFAMQAQAPVQQRDSAQQPVPPAMEAPLHDSNDPDQIADDANTGAPNQKHKRKGGAARAAGGGKRPRRGTTRAAGQAPGGGWTIGSLSHGASVALALGAGAAVAGVASAFALSGQSPSPSQ